MTEAEWLASTDSARMLEWFWQWALAQQDSRKAVGCSDRKLRLFACACCRRAMCEFPPGDEIILRSFEDGNGISAPRARSRGVDAVQGLPAIEAAMWWARSRGVGRPGYPDTFAVAKGELALVLRDICGNPFAPVAVWDEGESLQQGNTTCIPRRWLTPLVLSLAEAAYLERHACRLCKGLGVIDRPVICGPDTSEAEMQRIADEAGGPIPCPSCCGRATNGALDPVRLCVLADALEEAGCDHLEETWACRRCGKTENVGVWESQYAAKEQRMNCGNCAIALPAKGNVFRKSIRATHPLLAHLRSPGPHVRGCAALDAILGRE